MHWIVRVFAVLALVASALAAVAAPAMASVTSTVTSTGDAVYSALSNNCGGGLLETCTLRAAITRADNNGGGTIDFDIPGSGVQTIAVGSTGNGALPAITHATTIDGTTQPGYSGSPLIELDGAAAGTSADGLDLSGGNSTVKGLVINRFAGNGISLTSGNGDSVTASYIGTDSSGGTSVSGNAGDGVSITSSGNQVGGAGAGDLIEDNADGVNIAGGSSNTIASNTIGLNGDGVEISGPSATTNVVQDDQVIANYLGVDLAADSSVVNGNFIFDNQDEGVSITGDANQIQGNRIGTEPTGVTSGGPQDVGVSIEGSSNTVGGTSPGTGNLISGNASAGVAVSGLGATGNLIEGNDIGTDVTGSQAVANGDGISLGIESSSTTVGGTSPGTENVISGNAHYGVQVDSGNNVLEGNKIGTDQTGTESVPNTDGGIVILIGSSNTVGGADPGAGNLISGNGGTGVEIDSPSNVVEGNKIGTDATGTKALGNSTGGVEIGAPSTTVGGTGAGAGNLISGNQGDGVVLGGDAQVSSVEGNLIGTDASGKAPLGNTGDGVTVSASSNPIGGFAPGAGNVISNNGEDGILVNGGVSDTLQGNWLSGNAGTEIDLQNGGNNDQPAPVLTGADSLSGSTTISGNLTADPNSAYDLDFYTAPACEPSGHGPVETHLGSSTVTTDGMGQKTILITLPVSIAPGSVIVATATDAAGDTSEVSDCASVPSTDLSLSLKGSPNPVVHGSDLTYTATIRNLGLVTAAASVVFTDTLPYAVSFVSSGASQGSCSGTSTVTCNLGTIKAKKKATVTIVVIPPFAGKAVKNTATVGSSVSDPNPANNSAKVKTKVT